MALQAEPDKLLRINSKKKKKLSVIQVPTDFACEHIMALQAEPDKLLRINSKKRKKLSIILVPVALCSLRRPRY